ncbi:MAG: SAM-dependent methyltransferase, partial [Myxococcales bacterium]|nr:SAM-dependent methyltransferase [Myxococcales bacterium]
LFDDTVYFLPCADAAEAHALAATLAASPAREAIAALSFPDAKRTVTAALLARLDLAALRAAAR